MFREYQVVLFCFEGGRLLFQVLLLTLTPFFTYSWEAIEVLKRGLRTMVGWMKISKLKVNTEKVEIFLAANITVIGMDTLLSLDKVALPLKMYSCSRGMLLGLDLFLDDLW